MCHRARRRKGCGPRADRGLRPTPRVTRSLARCYGEGRPRESRVEESHPAVASALQVEASGKRRRDAAARAVYRAGCGRAAAPRANASPARARARGGRPTARWSRRVERVGAQPRVRSVELLREVSH